MPSSFALDFGHLRLSSIKEQGTAQEDNEQENGGSEKDNEKQKCNDKPGHGRSYPWLEDLDLNFIEYPSQNQSSLIKGIFQLHRVFQSFKMGILRKEVTDEDIS